MCGPCKQLAPLPCCSYDIGDLYSWVDNMPDLRCAQPGRSAWPLAAAGMHRRARPLRRSRAGILLSPQTLPLARATWLLGRWRWCAACAASPQPPCTPGQLILAIAVPPAAGLPPLPAPPPHSPPPHPQPPTPNPLPHPPCSALVFEAQLQAYVPCGKEWIKKKAFTHLRRMADQAR